MEKASRIFLLARNSLEVEFDEGDLQPGVEFHLIQREEVVHIRLYPQHTQLATLVHAQRGIFIRGDGNVQALQLHVGGRPSSSRSSPGP